MIEPLSGFTASCVSIPRDDSPDTVNSIRTAHLWKIEDHTTAQADRIAALETALRAVLNSDMAMREEDEGQESKVLNLVRAALENR